MLPESRIPMTPVQDLNHVQGHLLQPVIKQRVQKSKQLKVVSFRQPPKTDPQGASQPVSRCVLKARAKEMLDNCWQFDPKKHAVPAARGVLDPLYGLTNHEYMWFKYIMIRRLEFAQDQIREQTKISNHLTWKFNEPQDEPLLNEADLNTELNEFYGSTEVARSRAGSLSLDEGYADTDHTLLQYDWNNQDEATMRIIEAFERDEAERATQMVNHNDRSGFEQSHNQMTGFKDSGIFMEDGFATEAGKISPIQPPFSFDDEVEHNDQGRSEPQSRPVEHEALSCPPHCDDSGQGSSNSTALSDPDKELRLVESNHLQQSWDTHEDISSVANGIVSLPRPTKGLEPRGVPLLISNNTGVMTQDYEPTVFRTSQAVHQSSPQYDNSSCSASLVSLNGLSHSGLLPKEDVYQNSTNHPEPAVGHAESEPNASIRKSDDTDIRIFEEPIGQRKLASLTQRIPGPIAGTPRSNSDKLHMIPSSDYSRTHVRHEIRDTSGPSHRSRGKKVSIYQKFTYLAYAKIHERGYRQRNSICNIQTQASRSALNSILSRARNIIVVLILQYQIRQL